MPFYPDMNSLALLLLVLLLIAVVIQVVYALGIFSRNLRGKQAPGSYRQGVSVLICARNNRKGLSRHLESVLAQNYPEFEVVVVNDGSTDGTKALLEELEKKHEKLRVVWLEIDEKYHRGKKFALTMGIKAAKYPILLMTDSDCKPASPDWISKMVGPFSNPETEIVLGLGSYETKRSILNWIIQLDSFHTALLYTNFARSGRPYMGVGRNLAYRKDLFFKVKGFASHQHILSGDDDLFVNETANAKNTAVCLEPGSETISDAHTKFGSWVRQKLRHLTTSVHYKAGDQMRLLIYHLSLPLVYGLFIVLLILGLEPEIALILFGIYFVVTSFVLIGNMLRLNYRSYIPGFAFFHLFWILMILFLGIRRPFWRSKPKAWI